MIKPCLSLFGLLLALGTAAAGPQAENPPFRDAVAVWHMADLNDSAGANRALVPVGELELGIELQGADREASVRRGGDGKAARLSGGYLRAGQGAHSGLNLAGSALTMAIRLKDPSGNLNAGLFHQGGGEESVVYDLSVFNYPDRIPALYLGCELGTKDARVRIGAPTSDIPSREGWHDYIVRYTGKHLELFVDGCRLDRRYASGPPRQENIHPCVIGAEGDGGKAARPFRGLIDHAALWNRALTDDEIFFLSGGAAAVADRKKDLERTAAENAAKLGEEMAADPQRPRYHFLPPKSYMNDPNGLIHFRSEYHLFYQYSPFDAIWGTTKSWGHAVSQDLVNWKHLPHALRPDQIYDKDGIYSGTAVEHEGAVYAFYTGIRPEVQCVAMSRDLLTWEKSEKNPIIPSPPKGLDVTGFRDPYVWREDDQAYMVVGSGIKGVGGAILLYGSKDLLRWEYLGTAAVGDKTTGENWECPNLFQIGDKWVLIVSPQPFRRAIYFVGTFRDHKFVSERKGEIDEGGAIYAPQVFKDSRNRRLMFGWLWETGGKRDVKRPFWSGVLSLPRVLSLGPDGSLNSQPAEELQTLRAQRVRFSDLDVTPSAQGILGDHRGGSLEAIVDIDGGVAEEFGLKLLGSPQGEEVARVVYKPKENILAIECNRAGTPKRIHPTSLPLSTGDHLRLHVFLDRSVLEVFANGQTCLTSRIYPDRAEKVAFDVFTLGEKVRLKSAEIWDMNSIRR